MTMDMKRRALALLPPAALSRFVINDVGCWEWTGPAGRTGYGRLNLAGQSFQAYRFVYAALVGPIPEGLPLDHLCHNPPCVNPDHLEPVTYKENSRRGLSSSRLRKACAQGHSFAEFGFESCGRRRCRLCHRRLAREWRRRSIGYYDRHPEERQS